MIHIRVLMGLSLVLALSPMGGRSAAHAQWGWGAWGGWAGGAGTVQGDIARGLGNLEAGAGYYNQQMAVANSIDSLKDRADLVTRGPRGAGVEELVGRLIEDDLRSVVVARHAG